MAPLVCADANTRTVACVDSGMKPDFWCRNCLINALADAQEQVDVLSPGGSFAWKSKYEAIAKEIQERVDNG